MKINTISTDKHKFLQMSASIVDFPKELYCIGSLPEERKKTIAIVGTRKPSSYGQAMAQRFASELARRGLVIVSGLALGVDALAHRSALDVGGETIAVLGNGLPEIYPATNRALAEKIIASGGAILSEYIPHTPVRPWQFLARNRIVSGISDAVLIIEAAARSGTLSTAAHALTQGKDVFVIPGNITNPLSAGCNSLIKQGAHPATCIDDILEVIAPELLEQPAHETITYTSEEKKIMQLLGQGIVDGEALQKKSGLAPSEFNITLTLLEINGHIRALGGNRWSPI